MAGKAIIFCAPSGAGKSTIVRHLISEFGNIEFSISATTRKPRTYETNGSDYYFLSEEDFHSKVASGEILEWQEVYQGTYYGTLKEEVDRIWAKGNHVIFDVDVHGGLNLKKEFGDKALSVFIKVDDPAVLEERLKSRNTESDSSLKERVKKAEIEMREESKFDQVIVNNKLEEALSQATDIVARFIF